MKNTNYMCINNCTEMQDEKGNQGHCFFKNQEAINNAVSECGGCYYCGNKPKLVKIYNLPTNTPQEPEIYCFKEIYFHHAECPVCQKVLYDVDVNLTHCPHCGQSLDLEKMREIVEFTKGEKNAT